MLLSSNYALSSYGAIPYGRRAPAAYNFSTGETLTASDASGSVEFVPITIFPVNAENRKFKA